MHIPRYYEPDYVLFHHDRSIYCPDGDCVLVGNGQIFSIVKTDQNENDSRQRNDTITVVDNEGFHFQLQLSDLPNLQLFDKFILSQWNLLKESLKENKDYTDYIPAYYENLDAYNKGNMTIVTQTEETTHSPTN